MNKCDYCNGEFKNRAGARNHMNACPAGKRQQQEKLIAEQRKEQGRLLADQRKEQERLLAEQKALSEYKEHLLQEEIKREREVFLERERKLQEELLKAKGSQVVNNFVGCQFQINITQKVINNYAITFEAFRKDLDTCLERNRWSTIREARTGIKQILALMGDNQKPGYRQLAGYLSSPDSEIKSGNADEKAVTKYVKDQITLCNSYMLEHIKSNLSEKEKVQLKHELKGKAIWTIQ